MLHLFIISPDLKLHILLWSCSRVYKAKEIEIGELVALKESGS